RRPPAGRARSARRAGCSPLPPSFPTRRSSDLMSSVPLAQRAGGPDLARGLSLLGIALANMVGWLRGREWTVLLKQREGTGLDRTDRQSTRLNSSHVSISYAASCL